MMLLTSVQAAKRLHVSRSTFWRMRKDYPLKTFRVRRREMFLVEDLDEWFASKERMSAYADS